MSVTINPSLIPSVAPGNIFSVITTNQAVTVRWFVINDPVHADVLNRPLSDMEYQIFIIAKALDNLYLNVGHASTFPFLITAQLNAGTQTVNVPYGFIWDLNISLPARWSNLRLRKIQRISGINTTISGTDGDTYTFTGKLRLIFSGAEDDSVTETALAYADYDIDSNLTYQIVDLIPLDDTTIDSPVLDAAEINTVSGVITFKTLDQSQADVQSFLLTCSQPVDTTAGSDGLYLNPSVYEIADMVPGGTSGDFSTDVITHGTGLLTCSAWNGVPPLQSDIQSYIEGTNYPFDANANRKSVDNITIPQGIFREFSIVAPASDEPTGDVSGEYYPVWISKAEKTGTTDSIRLYFSTHNTTLDDPTNDAIEFAYIDLTKDMVAGQIVVISSLDNLKAVSGTSSELNLQGFGLGHVQLSSIWGVSGGSIDDLFDAINSIVSSPAETLFNVGSTRISSFGISRVPKYTPTRGQAEALVGSAERLTAPIEPSDTNRYVTEQDQGRGNQIDLEAQGGITPSTAIQRYGNSGALCHKIVTMTIDQSKVPDNDSTFYTTHVLPRLTILLGRAPIFGDMYYNGTELSFFNGSSWQTL